MFSILYQHSPIISPEAEADTATNPTPTRASDAIEAGPGIEASHAFGVPWCLQFGSYNMQVGKLC